MHNLIAFSIVFKNKNGGGGGGRFTPTSIKTKVKTSVRACCAINDRNIPECHNACIIWNSISRLIAFIHKATSPEVNEGEKNYSTM